MTINISCLEFVTGEKIELSPGSVVILVGPNNSGKSQALRDIESLCIGKKNYKNPIIKSVKITGLPKSQEDVKRFLEPFVIPITANDYGESKYSRKHFEAQHLAEKKHENQAISTEWLTGSTYFCSIFCEKYTSETDVFMISRSIIEEIPTKKSLQKKYIMPLSLIRLNGRARFKLINPEFKEKTSQLSHLRFLSLEDNLNKLNNIICKNFNKHIIVENSTMRLVLRVSENLEIKHNLEEYPLLIEQDDGIQCFVGMMSAIITRPQSIILIDKPEAFLTPSIARTLGRELTKIAKERNASLIVSTDSSDFVMGCIETANDPKIIRLAYQNQIATTTKIETNIIKEFDTNPCLRSSAAIKGLFHKAVIVTEGDGDRVFYDEINHRLSKINRDLDDVLFIDSGGINSINNFVTPLRRMGVPAAAIVDLDIITAENNAQWKKLLEECGVIEDLDAKRIACLQALGSCSGINHSKLKGKNTLAEEKCSKIISELQQHNYRKAYTLIEELKINLPKSKLKKGGILALNDPIKSAAIELLDTLACYGIFVVPVGELECWIPRSESDYTPKFKKGPEWKNNWIKEIGKPTNKDLNTVWWRNKWSFINKISAWIDNPERKGMPNNNL